MKCSRKDCKELVAFEGLCVQCIDAIEREDRKKRNEKRAAAAAKQKADEDAWYKDSKRSRKPRKE